MAKSKKSARALTDDWIKQIVTGQRRKLAHKADGGEIVDPASEPAPEPTPEPEPAPETPRAIDTIPADPKSTAGLLRGNWGKINAAIKEASGYKDGGAVSAEKAKEKPTVFSQEEALTGSGGIALPEPARITLQLPAPPQYDAEKEGKAVKTTSSYKNGGCVKRMEKGGDVSGPGTGTSDSVPAMLSDGEYVLPADTVDAVGKATLDKLKAATHTPANKPQTRGMVVHLVDGGVATVKPQYSDQQWALARKFYPNTDNPERSIENARRDNPAALQHAAGEIGNPPTPLQQSSALRFFDPTRVVSSGPTDNLPAISPAPAPAPAPTAPVVAPAAPAAAPAAAKPIVAPSFMPTMTEPNTAQDMVSEGRNLMNTQGIGGFVQAKGLNRMAQTVNQTNDPLIHGQYELQNTAMTANERLEQARLAEHQRLQNLETWTPDKNMMGELLGYGRTKGGTPQYVTKESLAPKPVIAEGATGKDSSGRAVVYKNGVWVAKQ
jgi:hypothetical protein